MKDLDEIKEIRTFVYSNAVIRVHIPNLTKEEQNKRRSQIEKAIKRLLKTK